MSALFGCLILAFTKTGFGAASGVLFVGAGYASVFPLVAEAIGRRFPYYHPGVFSGIFSVALMGGLLAPASIGYAASAGGGRGHGRPAARHMHGYVVDSVDLAGIEGNRKMRRAAGKPRWAWLAPLLLLATPLHAASLAEQIARLLDSSTATRTAFWGIQIVDLESGRTVYELNSDRGFVPASTAKLFTTALALVRLGPEFTFQTRVLAGSGPDADGRLAGPLTLAGGGDPNLSGRDVPYRMGSKGGNPLAALEELAGQVAARGVKRVDGDIVGDDSWYVWQPYAEGWAVDDPQFDFGAPVSALSIADNTVSLAVRPAARVGDPAELALDPPVEYFRIGNRVRTVRGRWAAGNPL